ncbi:MAG: CBS domain-containing protein [Gemmatimonadota bacterium]|nr:CBS domain-containing protein [Gemmatimonadota bacterium]MDE3128394.1 CBS domain-containing protein [Gemmatimonadota bacterium]MDE3172978.1 CBS domain-containing protein [Gemmatimonadota bacterium]MDE3215937.1 CBS domain-containing protein [Gemmatimonadota bacterium]
MKAQDLMTPTPTVITADESIPKTAEVMRNLDVGMLPVVDDLTSRKLIGVITDRDIVVRCLAEQSLIECQVRSHMSASPLVYVNERAPLEEIVEKMERFQVRRLPVVDARMRVVGIVTQADLAMRVGRQNPALVEEVLQRISTPGALVH